MAYTRINFKNQNVEKPRTYAMTDNQDGTVTLVDSFGVVTEAGTPIDATNMNHIEDGIVAVENSIDAKILSMLKAIYPVGAISISTTSTCPLSAFFGTWELVAENKALWTGDGTNANTTIEAGLPNIKGVVGVLGEVGRATSGAFYYHSGSGPLSNDGKGDYNAGFDASRYNPIYSDDVDTVQPPAYVVNVFRRVA